VYYDIYKKYPKVISIMKKAFTMIELIFVIVVLGMLASVAVPKLMATRTDAKIAAEISNLKQNFDNLKANYLAIGNKLINYTYDNTDCFRVVLWKHADNWQIWVASKDQPWVLLAWI
jgi:prepilin-type N-terminal cleavage/methylation domain-containing protein